MLSISILCFVQTEPLLTNLDDKPCRMQAHVCRLINKEVIYLNPMLLTERTIASYDIPDDSSALAKLNAKQRKKYRLDALIEYRYRASMYMLQATKKI
jgi:hypothetical protein